MGGAIERFNCYSQTALETTTTTTKGYEQKNKAQNQSKVILSAEERESMAAQNRGNKVVDIAPDGQEATVQNVAGDILRANDIAPAQDQELKEAKVQDELMASYSTWNNEGKDVQTLQNNVLTRFDYVPLKLKTEDGKLTRFSILTCSDNGLQVGRPFAGTYSLLDNKGFLEVVNSICEVLGKMGLKYSIATSGSLMDRERTFISLKIEGENDKLVIHGREFQAFLNCLNSIPSSSGCTVTFANNTFCVCCRNTFAGVLHDKEGAKFHAAIKHTKGMKACLRDVPLLVEAYFASNAELFKSLKAFNVFPVNLEAAEKFFAAFIGRNVKGELTDKEELTTRSANIIETLKGLHVRGKGNKGETALDLFSAVTEYYTHLSAGGDNIQKQIQSSEAGDGARSKQEFYAWLIAATQDKAKWSGICKVGDTLLIAWNKSAKNKVNKV